MSFVKRSAVLSARPGRPLAQATPATEKQQLAPGIRPSPLDGRPTTSTGTSSLDQLLAGHGGLPLGTCLLVEEQGTTDFSGILLRYYAAEGLVQGHQVHLVGYPPEWRHQLPGVAAPDSKAKAAQPAPAPEEKMRIAWRYEALGNTATPGASARGDAAGQGTFCHSFDLTKRLSPSACKGELHPTPSTCPPMFEQPSQTPTSPLKAILKHLQTKLSTSPPTSIHRIIIPGLLLPTLYAPHCALPSEVLQFLHGLRALLRQYPTQLTAIITLPTTLYPRTSGLVRWIELLCDGVVELIPLPANPGAPPPPPPSSSGSGTKSGSGSGPDKNEQPQGLLGVHTLPVYHEKGGGGAGASSFRETLAFSLSASRGLVIKPYSLPPLEAEGEGAMAAAAERQVRISRVAGRYLVFDIDDVVHIRRHHGICAVLTGTMPQNPTQNLFLGLPIELHAEEAKLLVDKGAGYIADELADHLSQLSAMDEATRGAYLQHLRQQRRSAQQVFDEEKAKVQARHQDKRKPKPKPAPSSSEAPTVTEEDTSTSLFSTPSPAPPPPPKKQKEPPLPGVTPTTSHPLLPTPSSSSQTPTKEVPPATAGNYPLYEYLNTRGYYTTPGLRFGGDYSVYPGDPFRYHAHYLANSYGWDEQVAMLDLVTSGRLGTAVKKGFLFGAEKPPAENDNSSAAAKGAGEVRVFCIEWAGM
ncbi:PAXNEB-domain-containing protein [Parachaetomium inaequale]|uniref:Elongator complex protein 4 n=1 Tax=Parachaetomium inaequale TaxID=2588326 RepID=A0AAN6SUQ3_9PEZI|nr:PAXNEB-domain-containing protein [Parachaetomium inaequale]